jgi:magnesium transporter
MSFKEYFLPKSLIYTGKHDQMSFKINHYLINENEVFFADHLEINNQYKHYIQIIGLSDTKKIKDLGNLLNIDLLVLEDILNVRQRDKIEIYKDFMFGVFHVNYIIESEIIEDYVSIVLLKDQIVSFHETEPKYLTLLHDIILNHDMIKKMPIDYVFYQIMDMITDHHLDVYESLEIRMNQYEEEILESRHSNQESFYMVRKHLLKLKNSISPIFEQLKELIKKKYYSNETIPYYEDLVDHMNRLDIQLNQSRELMRHLLDLHMNNQSNKMNKIMTTLTLFSAIFIPLSFLTGFFGMNFIHFGILSYEYAVWGFVGFCIILALGMILFFKKSKWL